MGRAYTPTVKAAVTMTLALPKQGMVNADVKQYIGELYLADISVPPSLYASIGLHVGPIFSQSEILRVEF